MSEIVLHADTEADLQRLAARGPGTFGLMAPLGFGKTYLAKTWLARALSLSEAQLVNWPYLLIIQPMTNTISIEQVRQLQHFLELKTPQTDQLLRRAIIVEHADSLSMSASNALLKTLEEPPLDTAIILTFADERSLLPTIRSRLQVSKPKRPTNADLTAYFKTQGLPEGKIKPALVLADNLPGLSSAILTDELEHPLLKAISSAKELLNQTVFDRLLSVNELAKQKNQALLVVEALKRIAQAGFATAAGKSNDSSLKRWSKVLKATSEAEASLVINVQPKLCLTELMMAIG